MLIQKNTHSLKMCGQILMPKHQPLYTSAKLNLRDRALGEIEKNSFIALPGKSGQSGLMPLKTMCPNPGEFVEFYGNSSWVGSLMRLGCVQGLYSSNLVIFLTSFFGSFSLASGGLLWYEEC